METIGIFAPRNMQCNHSCVFQFQFWSSFFLARNSQGLDPAVMLVCSKWDLLDMRVLPMGVASPGWIGRCNLGLAFTHGFIYSQLQVSSVQSLICVRLFAIPWTAARQASLSITNSWAYSNSCPLSQWCHPTISFSVVSFSSCLWSFPASGSLPMSRFFTSCGQSMEFQLQHQSFQWLFRTDFLQDGLVGSPCSPRDSQESAPTPQFQSINSSALSFLLQSNSHIHKWLLEKP